VLDQVARGVQVAVVVPLVFAAMFGRDDRRLARRASHRQYARLRIVAAIGDYRRGGDLWQQRVCPGDLFRLTAAVAAFIPTGRAINPRTGTDGEGVGVVPDVVVAEGDALAIAHRLALRRILVALDAVRDAADAAQREEESAAQRDGDESAS